MTTLESLSNDVSGAIARAAQSVVAVDARRRATSSGVHWREGIVVTADHAVKRDSEITLTLPDGREVPAELAGRDASIDVAILRFDGAGLRTADFASPDDLAVGRLAIAIARSDDEGVAATLGVVSALGGPWRTWHGGRVDRLIRPDLNIYPGFSGGPLIDGNGAVIGMNTTGLSRQTALTVPVSTIERVVGQLLKRGKVTRGYLGVGMQQVRLPDAIRDRLHVEAGDAVIVLSVEPGGPAERAGLFIGDVLISLDDQRIDDVHDVLAFLSDDVAGRNVRASIIRAGAVTEVVIAVGERPIDEGE
ncbi:MAG TPA: trypsin-like peptidase domain-containing protein [Candidatus Eremiobacteraceae bacterium]